MRRALNVAMTQREDLRSRTAFAEERIAGSGLAVVGEPHDLAAVVVQLLRTGHVAALTERHVHQPGAIEDDAGAEVVAAAALGRETEQDFHSLHAPGAGTTGELAARHLGAVLPKNSVCVYDQ